MLANYTTTSTRRWQNDVADNNKKLHKNIRELQKIAERCGRKQKRITKNGRKFQDYEKKDFLETPGFKGREY